MDGGLWSAIVPIDQLREATPTRFRAGPLEGYLVKHGNTVKALSAMCTHMACLPNWNGSRARFEYQCHGATLTISGQPVGARRWPGLAPLPRIEAHVQADQVEVYTVQEREMRAIHVVEGLAEGSTWPAI